MKVFDKYEKRGAYHWDWYRDNTFKYRDHVTRVLSFIPNGGSVLDVGCGDGCLAYHLRNNKHFVVGIDSSKVAIELAREKCNVNNKSCGMAFVNMSVTSLNGSVKYDYVVMHDVLEHVEDLPSLVLRKVHNVCRRFAIITTPNSDRVKCKSQYDNQLWDIRGIKGLFKPYSYECVEEFDTFFIKLMGK
jgi:2-polyprenyl-3-methyl-5-hydroxy-6-metoxy-1,4-benzoquinol methylase